MARDTINPDTHYLRCGDTVRLLSGGPLMTVEYLAAIGVCGCMWFDEGIICPHLRRETFYPHYLELVIDP